MAWEQLSMNRLEIPLKEVYSFMGYKDREADEQTRKTAEYLLRESAQFLRPQFKYVIVDGTVDLEANKLTLIGEKGPITFDAGKIICRQLRGAQKFAVFVATVGNGYFQWTDAVKRRDDMFQTYAMDCVGSQIVESVADYMETVLQADIDPASFPYAIFSGSRDADFTLQGWISNITEKKWKNASWIRNSKTPKIRSASYLSARCG